MTNREKLNDLSSNIKKLNKKLLDLDELVTHDGFGDVNEMQEFQNMPAKIHQATIDYHSFAVKIVHDKLELDDEYVAD